MADSGKNVYVAVSLAVAPGLHDTRIQSANSAGIFGLWADLDIADPDVHKKWNLPPTVDAALELLTMCDLDPTLIVHSGHGLQSVVAVQRVLAVRLRTVPPRSGRPRSTVEHRPAAACR